jgi:flagellar protein FlaG
MEIGQSTVIQQPNVEMSINSVVSAAKNSSESKAEVAQAEVAKVQKSSSDKKVEKVDSQEKMNALIEKLNEAIDPFKTSLKFGFDDKSENFYVSVIDTKTSETIRRFPAEDATTLLEKMNEVSGVLFDQKG